MSDRCADCDRPLAGDNEDLKPTANEATLCWRSWHGDICQNPAVNWRARALAAENALLEAKRVMGTASDHFDQLRGILQQVKQAEFPCSRCGGTCVVMARSNDDARFNYKRCTACGWEIAKWELAK